MKFSKWNYVRPDFSQVKKRINDCKNNMQNAMTYQMFRDAWLDVKKEIEYIYTVCGQTGESADRSMKDQMMGMG